MDFGMKGRKGKESIGQSRKKKKIWSPLFSCFAASWGGFLYGFDMGVSGGVSSMNPFLKKFFPETHARVIGDESVNQYFKFQGDNFILFYYISSLYWAALVVSPFPWFVRNKFGPKFLMLASGLIFFTGAAISAAAINIYMLIAGRMLLGIGFGLTDQCRGALNIFFQLMFTIGILVANLLTFGANNIEGDWGWRLSLAIAAVPGGLIIIGACIMPDTLNSIIERNDPEKAKRILRKIRGSDDVDEEFNDLLSENSQVSVENPWTSSIHERQYTPQRDLAKTIPFLQTATGANCFVLYSPILFRTLGFGSNASMFSSCVVCFVYVVATIVSVLHLDQKGRQSTLIKGGVQMTAFLLLAGILVMVKLGSDGVEKIDSGFAFGVVVCICGYIAAYGWSWGSMGWLLPSDLCPPEIQSTAQLISLCYHLYCTSVYTLSFPSFMCYIGYGVFFLFAFAVALLTLVVWNGLPKTKGTRFEEMWIVMKGGKRVSDEMLIEMGGRPDVARVETA